MAALKLYGAAHTTNTARVVTLLHELGLDYEFIQLELSASEHKKPEYLALNPFGMLPTLVDGDIVVYETRAIGRYLTTHYQRPDQNLLNSGSKSKSAMVELWLEVESQQFNPPAAALFFEETVKGFLNVPADGAVVEAQLAKLPSVLDVYEKRLGESKYIAGDDFTLADLNHMPYLYTLSKSERAAELIASRPRVRAWWEKLSERPAWKKASAQFPY